MQLCTTMNYNNKNNKINLGDSTLEESLPEGFPNRGRYKNYGSQPITQPITRDLI